MIVAGTLAIAAAITSLVSQTAGTSTEKLRQLLGEGRWRQADVETWLLLSPQAATSTVDPANSKPPDVANIRKFPCGALKAVDHLWAKNSGNKFGLTAQKNIWQNIDGYPNAASWFQFAEQVGWKIPARGNEGWIPYGKITFTSDAPRGHLPTRVVGTRGASPSGPLWNDWGLERDQALMERLSFCKRPSFLSWLSFAR
ncbi:MAG: GUN4 domain-containing protein [Cyanobacteriota bacterium]